MRNLTIRDIARMANVSPTAVSFVLNGRPGVSDATRKKVQEIIRRTGFTPNAHTRRLNLGKSFTVHVVLRQYGYSLYNQFALETLSGIFAESKSLGYSIVFTFVDDRMNCEQLIDSVRGKDCDGVILYQVADPGLISMLRREETPFVCVDAHIPKDGKLPLVEVDYYDAALRATRYLHECGHTKIGFIGPVTPADYYISTFRGYNDALREAGLPCKNEWISEIPYSEQSAAECVETLLRRGDLPTAFLCAGDSFAIDTIRCAKSHGLRIPEDISIMGLDDLLVSRYLDPALSTMTFPKDLLGKKAMQLLFRLMQGKPYSPVNLISTELIERDSVKKLI